MNNHLDHSSPLLCATGSIAYSQDRISRRGALHLVTPFELQNLREALAASRVPLDLQAKLARCAKGQLLHTYIERNSRLFLALLMAAQTGSFPGCRTSETEHLLRVLAYVRKDDDAIPDYQSGGYADDHQEMRAAIRTLQELLTRFKLWRLRHDVPKQWRQRYPQTAETPQAHAK